MSAILDDRDSSRKGKSWTLLVINEDVETHMTRFVQQHHLPQILDIYVAVSLILYNFTPVFDAFC